jgi:hypothetical protein
MRKMIRAERNNTPPPLEVVIDRMNQKLDILTDGDTISVKLLVTILGVCYFPMRFIELPPAKPHVISDPLVACQFQCTQSTGEEYTFDATEAFARQYSEIVNDIYKLKYR